MEEKNNTQSVSVIDALNITIGTLEGISIPASVLAVLSPAGIQTVMKQVIMPIQQAKGNLQVLLDYEKQAAEEAMKKEQEAPEGDPVTFEVLEGESDAQ